MSKMVLVRCVGCGYLRPRNCICPTCGFVARDP